MDFQRIEPGLIALDADGVLLDYNLAYAGAWQRAFGTRPSIRDPNAYWAHDQWDVPKLVGSELNHFRACFDEEFWSAIPAIDGAQEACDALIAMGNTLVCVTAMDRRFAAAREANLKTLGFPIQEVIVVEHRTGVRSPKADAIEALAAVAFVDDFLPYFRGICKRIHCALVLRQPNGSPNICVGGEVLHSQHADLRAFAHAWPRLAGLRE